MERSICILCADNESESHMLLICPEMQRWREELLRKKRQHVNYEISLRVILAVNKATEQGNLGTLV
jgi:hypothetical protein